MTATPVATIETLHEDMIHDCQFDYYAKKIATCSSDRTIKIFDVTNGDKYHLSATLQGHDGPIWQVCWAHPKFGVLLASCAYDGSVIIHRETREAPQNQWEKVFETILPNASVNSVAWAPHEFGLILACGSSDGRVTIIEHKLGEWNIKYFKNDSLGCNSVSWAPYSSTSVTPEGLMAKRLVTGSCDNSVRIWRCTESDTIPGNWVEEPLNCASPHSDWVRDVAWAPLASTPYSIIASCSEDRTVFIWKQGDKGRGPWEATLLRHFNAPVWRVSWSVTGNVLAVSCGDQTVTLWKQSVDETWLQISSVEDGNATAGGNGFSN